MIIDPEKLAGIELSRGGHADRTQGMCLLESAAYLAGEEHSYHPECVSEFIMSAGVTLNDQTTHERRQRLIQFLPSMLGTRNDGLEGARMKLYYDSANYDKEGYWVYPHNPFTCTDEEFEEVLAFFAELIKPTTR